MKKFLAQVVVFMIFGALYLGNFMSVSIAVDKPGDTHAVGGAAAAPQDGGIKCEGEAGDGEAAEEAASKAQDAARGKAAEAFTGLNAKKPWPPKTHGEDPLQ